MEPRRGPGRPRNGGSGPAAAQPPKAETAVEHLARLQAMRDANGGYLIPPPSGIQNAQLIEPKDPDGRLAGQLVRNDPMKRALAHMQELAEVGSLADLQLFWETWHPLAMAAGANPKLNLMAEYQALAAQAYRRHDELVRRADEEQRPARAIAECKRNLAIAEQRLEAERKRFLGPAEAEVARCKALLAQAERAMQEAA